MPRLTVEVDEAVYRAAQRRAVWERRGLREQLAVDLRTVYGCDRPAKALRPAPEAPLVALEAASVTPDPAPAAAGAGQ